MVPVSARAAGFLISTAVCAGLFTGCSASGSRDGRSSPDRLHASSVEELRKGDLEQALAHADSGLDAAGTDPASATAVRFRLLKAEILLFRRAADEAAALLAVDLPTTPAFAALRARRRHLDGQLLLVRGRLDAAVETLAEATRMAHAAKAPDVAMDAEVLGGQVLLRLGRWDEAEPMLAQAVAAAEAAGDRFRQMVGLHNLGMGRLVRSRFDEAVPFFDRVLSFRDLDAYTVYATALTNAALCYARLGEFDRSVDALRRAIETHERLGARTYLEQALGELGSTYVLRGDFDQAVTYLTRALETARQVGQDGDAALWAANLASAHLEQERWADAERFNAQATQLRGDARNLPYRVLFDARILEGRGQLQAAVQRYTEAAALGQDDPNVQWRVSARLGWIAHASRQPREASKHFDEALAVVERTRSDLLRQDDRLSIQARLVDLYYQYADVLVSNGRVEHALSIADSGRAAELAERTGANVTALVPPSEFRRLARQIGGVLLFYWLGESRTYAWVVTGENIRLATLPATEPEIDALVGDYRRVIVESMADPLGRRSPGDRLYETLIAPIARWIPSGSRVIVVPDGSLSALNFEALPVPGARRHYWIEDVEIAVAPSLGSLMTASQRRVPPDRPLLLIGDAVSVDPRFPALRYASAEMRAIAGAFEGRATVYQGARASPDGYRDAGPERFGIVHFTAHAAANAESPLDSAVVLSRGKSGYKLYARDVADRPLSADLVTISACRSAGERTYAGEGLVGFAWAFLRAGARQVIAGLWDVDDRSTADLMARLYSGIAHGDSPGSALRAAKLAMLAGGGPGNKPYYWAPFQIFVGSAQVP